MFNQKALYSVEMALPPMLEKSNMSMKAASVLASSRSNECWNSSVHCSYYSLLQMMIHLLIDVKSPPLDLNDLLKKSHGDTHNRIKEAILMEIESKNEMASFSSGFDFIRRMRVNADYRLEHFKQDTCLEIKQKSDSLRNKAESYFRKNGRDKK